MEFSFRRLGHWVMSKGWDFGGGGGGKGGLRESQKNFFRNSTKFGVWVTYINDTCNSTIYLVPTLWGPGEGLKGQKSLNLNYKVNFKYF